MKNEAIRIIVMSDLHLEFEFVPRHQQPSGPDFSWAPSEVDLVLLAGDIWVGAKTATWICEWAERFGVRVAWIAGNHEYYGQKIEKTMRAFRKVCAGSPIVNFLEQDVVELKVRDRAIRVLGCTLWTDYDLHRTPVQSTDAASYMLNDHRKITEDADAKQGIYTKFRPDHALRRHIASRAWLQGELAKPFDGPTVVMTHHAPHRKSIEAVYKDDRLTPAYVSDLSATIEEHDIALWAHGHIHTSKDYVVSGTRVVCNPRGYVGHATNPSFDTDKIIDV